MFLRTFHSPVYRSLRPSIARNLSTKPPPLPTIPSCPSPTCYCSETPEMPQGFPIDHSNQLNGTMAPYAEQVIICTGQDDWRSKIEDENQGDNLAADIKKLVGPRPRGEFHDPSHPISVLNSSLESVWDNPRLKMGGVFAFPKTPQVAPLRSVYLLPSFKFISFFPRDIAARPGKDVLSAFGQAKALTKQFLTNSPGEPKTTYLNRLCRVEDVTDVLVLICGHGGRDVRCGILGPVLRREFRAVLTGNAVAVEVPTEGGERSYEERFFTTTFPPMDHRDVVKRVEPDADHFVLETACVGLVSHVGGHKFAGNVMVYIPPRLKKQNGEDHELAGCGVWYGRVEPKHVEGIVRETILGGRIIQDMFRGGIRQGGEILRM